MHEMSLCESILRIVEDEAEAGSFTRVRTVRLEIGRFAGVEIEALRFAFGAVTRDSLADGARLEIIELPGEAWCMNCGTSVQLSQRFDPCPGCNGHELQITGGTQMRVKDLEVD